MSWLKDFFTNIFGNFWGSLVNSLMKIVMGPVVYFLFNPLFKLSGMMVEKILSLISTRLGDVGVSFSGLAAWLVQILLIQESLSMLLTFLIMGLTISFLKKVF